MCAKHRRASSRTRRISYSFSLMARTLSGHTHTWCASQFDVILYYGKCVCICLQSVKRKLNNNLRSLWLLLSPIKKTTSSHQQHINCMCVCWAKQFKYMIKSCGIFLIISRHGSESIYWKYFKLTSYACKISKCWSIHKPTKKLL